MSVFKKLNELEVGKVYAEKTSRKLFTILSSGDLGSMSDTDKNRENLDGWDFCSYVPVKSDLVFEEIGNSGISLNSEAIERLKTSLPVYRLEKDKAYESYSSWIEEYSGQVLMLSNDFAVWVEIPAKYLDWYSLGGTLNNIGTQDWFREVPVKDEYLKILEEAETRNL